MGMAKAAGGVTARSGSAATGALLLALSIMLPAPVRADNGGNIKQADALASASTSVRSDGSAAGVTTGAAAANTANNTPKPTHTPLPIHSLGANADASASGPTPTNTPTVAVATATPSTAPCGSGADGLSAPYVFLAPDWQNAQHLTLQVRNASACGREVGIALFKLPSNDPAIYRPLDTQVFVLARSAVISPGDTYTFEVDVPACMAFQVDAYWGPAATNAADLAPRVFYGGFGTSMPRCASGSGATPTATVTPTATSASASATPSSTPAGGPTATSTPNQSAAPADTPSNQSNGGGGSENAAATNTPTGGGAQGASPTSTPTNMPTATPANALTSTPTSTPTNTPTSTPTVEVLGVELRPAPAEAAQPALPSLAAAPAQSEQAANPAAPAAGALPVGPDSATSAQAVAEVVSAAPPLPAAQTLGDQTTRTQAAQPQSGRIAPNQVVNSMPRAGALTSATAHGPLALSGWLGSLGLGLIGLSLCRRR